MFHSILQRGMTAIVARNEKPSLAAHRELLRSIAMEEIEAYRAKVPVPSDAAFTKRRDEALDACDIFLRREEQRASEVTAKFFEVPFGFGPEEGAALSLEEPLVIRFSDGELRLRGRIDRVDRNDATGTWEVWDYKTGSLWDYRDTRWRLLRGTKVQHAVYARALREMLRAKGIDEDVSCSGYYFPTRKGDGELNARECDDAELERALSLAFDVVGRGFFPLPAGGACTFCDFKPVCRGADAEARYARKFEANADDPAVKAWRALQEVL